ncbi:MAG TPA: phosphatase PAP2 family protein, partial [Bacteroidia bacterium]
QNKIFTILHVLFLCVAFSVIIFTDKLRLHLFLNDFVASPFNDFFKYLTYVGDGIFVILVALVMLFFNAQKSLTILLCYGASTGFTQGIKYYFFGNADRPSLIFETLHIPLKIADGVDLNLHHSFPSGHATAAFSLFFCLSFFSKNNLMGIIYFISALLVAFSRVYLSQHFFEDITVGSLIGVSFSFLVCFILYETKIVQRMNKLQKPIYKFF